MKKLIFLLSIIVSLAACQNSVKKKATEEVKEFSVDQILEQGDDFVGKKVIVCGMVSHVCRHSGKRCFLMGSTEDVSIKVEAGNKIGSFTQEQMGSDLKIEGILQEIRIDEAYVAEMEAEEEEHEHAEEKAEGDQCSDESNRIAELRTEISESPKGYLSIFFMEGEQILETK